MNAAVELRRERVDRIVDIATVVLISLAALGTAWCSYESARWSALQALNYSKANAARVEASTQLDRANARRIVDVLIFAEYERALDQREAVSAFVRQRFRSPLKEAMAAWEATNPLHNPKAPPSPFALSIYHLPEEDAAQAASARADAFVESAVAANDHSDRYIFLTVLFAAASFLGGIAIKLRSPMNVVTTCIGALVFFISLAIMLHYPIR